MAHNNGPHQDSGPTNDAGNTPSISQAAALASQMSASQALAGAASAQAAPFNALAANNAFTDPNVMMMTNAVATIAAMAASTMQQASQTSQVHHAPMQQTMHGHQHAQAPPNAAIPGISPQVAAAARKLLASGGAIPTMTHAFNPPPQLPQSNMAALLEMGFGGGAGAPAATAALSSLLAGAAAAAPPATTTPPPLPPQQLPPPPVATTSAPQPAPPVPPVASAPPTTTLHPLHAALPTPKSSDVSSIGGLTNAAIASQQVAHASAFSQGQYNNALLPGMQSWTLQQLEHHAKMLNQLNQPVPQTVAMLLAEARRKEEKRAAKRVANRKSACTSRARKKALLEEMARTNARLRRHALILSLLPDLVIAVTLEGEITFCSEQAERVLKHDVKDLIGVRLEHLIVPSSREALKSLVNQLLRGGSASGRGAGNASGSRKRRASGQANNGSDANGSKAASAYGNDNSNASGQTSSQGRSSDAAVVSEQSFPLSVVEVDSMRPKRAKTQADTSDTSTGNGSGKQQTISSLTNSANLSRSPTAAGSSVDGEVAQNDSTKSDKKSKKKAGRKNASSDDASSLSSDAKNMQRANENLDRNVRLHNKMKHTKKSKGKGPKDDVTGASVTANNASARLSSLKHVPEPEPDKKVKAVAAPVKQEEPMAPPAPAPAAKMPAASAPAASAPAARYESNGEQSSSDDSLLAGVEEKKKGENASDDSGYRESNDSREETSSSGSDTSTSKDRQQDQLSPTSKLRLIRSDLTTVWCEVTSSVRTRSAEEDGSESSTPTSSVAPKGAKSPPRNEGSMQSQEGTKEILLCLRPIRDGDKLSDESLRLYSKKNSVTSTSNSNSTTNVGTSLSAPNETTAVSSSSAEAKKQKSSSSSQNESLDAAQDTSATSSGDARVAKRPPKKRVLSTTMDPLAQRDGAKRQKSEAKKGKKDGSPQSSETEKSVVESLMLMNKSQ